MYREHVPLAATLEIKVGNLRQGAAWYEQFIGRPADLTPVPDIHEWELFQGFWIQVTEAPVAENAGRLRLNVADVAGARSAIIKDLGADVSEVFTLPEVVAFCDFDDPWGNPLGLFQDLSTHPLSS